MLMADYKLLYGLRYIGIDFDFNAVIMRTQAGKEVKVVTAMRMAEVTIHLHQYANAIHFANLALNLIPCTPAVYYGNFNSVVFSCYPQLLPYSGTITFEDETKCFILLIRATAYIGMQQTELAFRDIKEAEERCRTA